LAEIKKVLPRIDYLFSDCKRDLQIAQSLGYKGEILGIFPGGGGYDFAAFQKYHIPLKSRRTILIKGYEDRSGRAGAVLRAIEGLVKELRGYKIVIFGADKNISAEVGILNKQEKG